MLQADQPDTYILATNRTETVRDFVSMAGKAAGIDLVWEGEGIKETASDKLTGKIVVRINEKFYRPAEVDLLIGNPDKARRELGWQATTTLETLCKLMMEADMRRNKAGHTF